MVSFSEPAQECRIRPTGHTQDTKNTFLQTPVASMTWLFESEQVYLWSVWPQLKNIVCKSNIHGPLDNFTCIIQLLGQHTSENPL